MARPKSQNVPVNSANDGVSSKTSDNESMYGAYVRGDSIQAIAEAFKVEVHEVLKVVESAEVDRTKG